VAGRPHCDDGGDPSTGCGNPVLNRADAYRISVLGGFKVLASAARRGDDPAQMREALDQLFTGLDDEIEISTRSSASSALGH
jgi:hypothetical protein